MHFASYRIAAGFDVAPAVGQTGRMSHALASSLRTTVTAAALTPFTAAGEPRPEAATDYARRLLGAGVGALAVAVHTGRGPHLERSIRTRLVEAVSSAADVPTIVGVGGAPELQARTTADVIREFCNQSRGLADAGAGALLLFPPERLTGKDHWVLTLHEAVAQESGLPVIAFVLYEGASGFCYSPQLAAKLAESESVLGVKVALLSDAVRCQETLKACHEARPDAVLFTGEDRMLGASLMWGAEAALAGVAAAFPELTVATQGAWRAGRHHEFIESSRRLDQLAQLVFRSPMDGYVQRMAWAAEWQELLPAHLCHDPFAPPQVAAERDIFMAELDRLAFPGPELA